MPPARYIQLTPGQEAAVKHLYRRTDNADVRSRCQMILLSAQGHSTAEIADLTFFDQDTVLFWFNRYEADGLAGLQDRPRPGRPPKMTGSSRNDLEQAADQDPRDAGHPFSVWTCDDLAHYLAQKEPGPGALCRPPHGGAVADVLAQAEPDRAAVEAPAPQSDS